MRRLIALTAALVVLAPTYPATCVRSTSDPGRCWSILGTPVFGTGDTGDAVALMAIGISVLTFIAALRLQRSRSKKGLQDS